MSIRKMLIVLLMGTMLTVSFIGATLDVLEDIYCPTVLADFEW